MKETINTIDEISGLATEIDAMFYYIFCEFNSMKEAKDLSPFRKEEAQRQAILTCVISDKIAELKEKALSVADKMEDLRSAKITIEVDE